MTASQVKKIKIRKTLRRSLMPRILGGVKILLAVAFFGLFFSHFFLASELSTWGGEINKLADDLERIKLENQLLENQLADSSSLSHIRKRAQDELGMKSTDFEFLTLAQLAQLPQ